MRTASWAGARCAAATMASCSSATAALQPAIFGVLACRGCQKVRSGLQLWGKGTCEAVTGCRSAFQFFTFIEGWLSEAG